MTRARRSAPPRPGSRPEAALHGLPPPSSPHPAGCRRPGPPGTASAGSVKVPATPSARYPHPRPPAWRPLSDPPVGRRPGRGAGRSTGPELGVGLDLRPRRRRPLSPRPAPRLRHAPRSGHLPRCPGRRLPRPRRVPRQDPFPAVSGRVWGPPERAGPALRQLPTLSPERQPFLPGGGRLSGGDPSPLGFLLPLGKREPPPDLAPAPAGPLLRPLRGAEGAREVGSRLQGDC